MTTDDSLTALRLEVFEAFSLLNDARYKFMRALTADVGMPVLLDTPTSPNPATWRQRALELVTQFFYEDGQDPSATIKGKGIVAISVNTVPALENLNAAKHRFETSMIGLRKAWGRPKFERTPIYKDLIADCTKRCQAYEATLNKQSLARLCLKQAYRKLLWVPEDTTEINFTFVKKNSKRTRIKVADARGQLMALGDDAGIREQLARLAQFADSDHLVTHKPGTPHWRANIKSLSGPYQIKAHTPIFVVRKPDEHLPLTNLGEEVKRERETRSDCQQQENAIAPAIHLYAVNH